MKRIIFELREDDLTIFTVSDEYLQKCSTMLQTYDSTLLDYLNNSLYYSLTPAFDKDIFTNSVIEHNGTLRTDGKWIWSSCLHFYTENYNFTWPESFLRNFNKQTQISISEDEFNEIFTKYTITANFIKGFPIEENKDRVLNYSIVNL